MGQASGLPGTPPVPGGRRCLFQDNASAVKGPEAADLDADCLPFGRIIGGGRTQDAIVKHCRPRERAMAAMFDAYWSMDEIVVNLTLLAHVVFAFLLGTLIGYERTYHAHAAGMRTYALVCTASAVLVIVGAYPSHWYGGLTPIAAGGDPTRIIQGVVTGIGFLCAGVIIKEGFSIRGLSTSASIWMTAAIGVIVGLGFFLAAIGTTLLILLAMGWFRGFEQRLPHQDNVHLTISFHDDQCPEEAVLVAEVEAFGFKVVEVSYAIDRRSQRVSYLMLLQAGAPVRSGELACRLKALSGLADFNLSPWRS
jgi:putative Mg2+ transporter-C (MgtC) family protein